MTDVKQIKEAFNSAYDLAWESISEGDAEETAEYIRIAKSVLEIEEHIHYHDVATMQAQIKLVQRGLNTIS